MEKNNQQRTHERKTTNFKQIMDAQKAEKEKELLIQKNEDLNLLDSVCDALNRRIYEITDLREHAQENGKRLQKEDTKISIADVFAYFNNNDATFPTKNRISILITILIDLAKCQVNTKLMDYHIAIRMLYFGEKFQSYFSPKFDEKRQELISKYEYLFDTWNLSTIEFTGDQTTDVISMPISNVGFLRVEPFDRTENVQTECVNPSQEE